MSLGSDLLQNTVPPVLAAGIEVDGVNKYLTLIRAAGADSGRTCFHFGLVIVDYSIELRNNPAYSIRHL